MSRTIYYALSIFLKSGDVLHLSGLTREEKDRYFALARNPEQSMLLESENGIRNLLGSDIASITFKKYTKAYEQTLFQIEKMFMSESSFGTGVYFTIIKLFIFLALLFALKEMVTGALQGDLMSTIMDGSALGRLFTNSLASAVGIFKYAYVIMLAIALVDLVLGLLAKYYINMDGAPVIKTQRFMGLLITLVFMIVVSIARTLFLKV